MACIGHACKVASRKEAATEVHDGVGIAFDYTIAVLRLILMLMVGLRFILRDEKRSQNIINLLGNFILASISDESGAGTALADVVRQSVDKLLVVLDTIDITNQSVSFIKIWAMVLPSSSASGSGFVVARNVEDRTTGLEVFLEAIIGGNHSIIVSDDLTCGLDIFRLEARIWAK